MYIRVNPLQDTAIPEEPFSNKFGSRAGRTDGSFCDPSKFGVKLT